MKLHDFNKIINHIIVNCVELKNKYVEEKLNIDYICIFSQTEEEHDQLLKLASSLGTVVEQTKTGSVFKFNSPPQTVVGRPKLLKVRIPDKTRPQRGDVDFNSNYEQFKAKYLDNEKFKLAKKLGWFRDD